MLKSFALCDGKLDNKRVGTFSCDTERKTFSLRVDNSIPLADLPLSLEMLVHKGDYIFGHEDTLRWVRMRLCPPGRHNIREILSGIGLSEYDEMKMLEASGARCDRDELFIVECRDD